MRSQLLNETIKALWPVKRTTCIEGPPGGGKTTIVQEVAKELGVNYIEKHMPTMLVEDFGVPYPNKEGTSTHYLLPEWWPRDPQSEGILCFDDRNQASADLQKVLANICQARNLHGEPLPKGWMVISTGNRVSDRAGANRVLSHLRNRETVIELDTNVDDWTKWALNNGVKPEVIAFIRFRPDLLHNFEALMKANPGAELFASPRSWVEGVSMALGAVPAAAEFECFKGSVGEGAAAEFVGFVQIYRDLPSPDAILMDPDHYELFTKPAVQYALAAALANKADKSNFKNVIRYLSRMPGEFSVLGVTLAIKKTPELTSTKPFIDWAVNHQDVLF